MTNILIYAEIFKCAGHTRKLLRQEDWPAERAQYFWGISDFTSPQNYIGSINSEKYMRFKKNLLLTKSICMQERNRVILTRKSRFYCRHLKLHACQVKARNYIGKQEIFRYYLKSWLLTPIKWWTRTSLSSSSCKANIVKTWAVLVSYCLYSECEVWAINKYYYFFSV